MVYKVLRFIVRICLKLSFKKIHIHGEENLLPGQPYFITCNHPSGFMEPLLLSCFLDRELHFLVRGDVFNNPFLRPILIATNEIPIYRTRDGFSNLRNNAHTFSKVAETLAENEAILIFIEGSTQMVKRLRPLQKGMARMTLRSMDQIKGLSPKVLPIGMSFTEPLKLREEVIIEIGAPINLESYFEIYKQNNNQGIHQLTEGTFQAMSKCMIEVDEEKESAHQSISRIWRTQFQLPFWPVKRISNARFEQERKLASSINSISIERLEEVREESDKWMKDHTSDYNHGNILLLFPALIGYTVNWIPARLGKWFADTVIETKAFYATITMIASMVAFIVYYLLIILIIIYLKWTLLWLPILGIITGILYLYYRHSKIEDRNRKMSSEMEDRRKEILNKLEIDINSTSITN